MELKPYDQNAACPKCLNDKIDPDYFGMESEHSSLNYLHLGTIVKQEHLTRRCSACGYSWPEACADAEPDVNELPIVWIDKIPDVFDVVSKKYCLICPHCGYDGDSIQLNAGNKIVFKVAIEKGYDYACRGCGKDYLVRIRPEDTNA